MFYIIFNAVSTLLFWTHAFSLGGLSVKLTHWLYFSLRGPVMKLKNLSKGHSILLDAVENDFQLFIRKESYEIANDL